MCSSQERCELNRATFLAKSAAAGWRGVKAEAGSSRRADVEDLDRVLESTVKAASGLECGLATGGSRRTSFRPERKPCSAVR